jgi:hypothetical protein
MALRLSMHAVYAAAAAPSAQWIAWAFGEVTGRAAACAAPVCGRAVQDLPGRLSALSAFHSKSGLGATDGATGA